MANNTEAVTRAQPVSKPPARQQRDNRFEIEEILQEVTSLFAPVAQDEGLYEGQVTVKLEGTDGIRATKDFIEALRATPQLRVLRLDSRPGQPTSILVSLREPFRLRAALQGMAGVEQVQEPETNVARGTARTVHVQLRKAG
jgi:hypothetical protein